ncbi:uncharacterized protein LOC113504101 isoform X2 [Trichoplusia ni]|uniref:Uncharacterized protein LOC113504101 isoform X2 n=1 Tax=Trichoplusia ni TaxID=7111 RepID=A0A7E5WNU2_TRINI|nr:uncharacterized protein LOC113504101 isoform X2 [Trichoplusia ni]
MYDLYDEVVNQDNIYPYPYSLWEDSIYYSTKNLHPYTYISYGANPAQFIEPLTPLQMELRASIWPEQPSLTVEAPDIPDCRKRRIIDRGSLYDDPVKFHQNVAMIQKMRLLGLYGTDAIEPAFPAAFAKNRIDSEEYHFEFVGPVKPKKVDAKITFEMNVLLNILDFVQNNSEVEVVFDRRLKKDERKHIHNIVLMKLKADDLEMVDVKSTAHMELLLQISDKNCYELQTRSSGMHPYRKVCLYKEAPSHVFLIIPDDLKEFPVDDDEEEFLTLNRKSSKLRKKKQTRILGRGRKLPPSVFRYKEEGIQLLELEEEMKIEIEGESENNNMPGEEDEETNPFLISITRNLKAQKPDSDSQDSEFSGYPMDAYPLPDVDKEPQVETSGPQQFRGNDGISESEISGWNEDFLDTEKTLQSILSEAETPTLRLPPIESFIPSPMSEILARICDYFIEFTFDPNYSQFKFLGPFTDEEIYAVNEFLEDAMKYLNNESGCHLTHVFDMLDFDINEDASGNTVLYKTIVLEQQHKKKAIFDRSSSLSKDSPKKMFVDVSLDD